MGLLPAVDMAKRAAVLLGCLLSVSQASVLPLGEPETGSLGPVNPEDRYWMSTVAHSNASAVFSIPGRDITKPWPGTSMDGWTLNMTAMDLFPSAIGWDLRVVAPESLYSDSPKPSAGGNFSDEILYNVTNGKEIKVDPEWVVCTWFTMSADDTWENMTRSDNPKDLATKPDGDCSQWLSDKCVKALEKTAQTSYSRNKRLEKYTYQPRVSCKPLGWPDECKDDTTVDFSDVLGAAELPARYLTGATTFTNGYVFRQRDEDEGNDFDPSVNETSPPKSDAPGMWQEMTREWLGVMTMFGHYNSSEDSYEGEPGFAKMSCIRPEKRKGTTNNDGKDGGKSGNGKGSDDKADGGKDSGVSARGITTTGVYAASLMMVYLLW